MTQIKTTWGKVFENINVVLLNNYPKIATQCGNGEELLQWETYDADTDEYYEIFQWYIIGSDYNAEWLQEYCPEMKDDIHYSEMLGRYVLAVRHLGTSWDAVRTTLEVDDESLAELYQKIYHDDLPADVKRVVFGENVKEGQ